MRNLIAAFLICGTAVPATAQAVSGVREAGTRFTAALSAGDAATAASFFADDGVALPPGRAELSGKGQIQQFLGNMTRAVKELKYVPEDVKQINDQTAREVGTFSFKPQRQGGPDVTGKYLVIWAKVDGEWKISADMWNRSSTGSEGGRQGTGKGGRQGGAKAGGAATGTE
jgi:uncharacterized protein (TIGR02246 family)